MTRTITTLMLAVFGMAAALHAQTPESGQLRGWLRVMPQGQPIRVTLDSGEVLEGNFMVAENDRFSMYVELQDGVENPVRGGGKIRRWVDYDDVADLSGEGIEVGLSRSSLADRVRAGEKARVYTSTGEILDGKIDELDAGSLLIRDRTLSLSDGDVLRIDVRVSDPLWDGTLIGLGVGAGLGVLVAATCDDPDCGEVIPAAVATFVILGTSIGFAADALSKSFTTIYVGADADKKLTFAPLLTPDKRGVLVSFSF